MTTHTWNDRGDVHNDVSADTTVTIDVGYTYVFCRVLLSHRKMPAGDSTVNIIPNSAIHCHGECPTCSVTALGHKAQLNPAGII